MKSLMFVSFILGLVFNSSPAFSETFVKISCFQKTEDGLGQLEDKSFFLEIGRIEDGLPLISLKVDDKDQTSQVRQFQFEVNKGKITSHFVWVENVESLVNSKNSDFNRSLNIAKMVTIEPKTADENISYELTRVIRNVDAEFSDSTVVKLDYVCKEPELI